MVTEAVVSPLISHLPTCVPSALTAHDWIYNLFSVGHIKICLVFADFSNVTQEAISLA